MILVEKIKEDDLWQLSKLYSELVEKKSSITKMMKVYSKLNKDSNYYLLGLKINDKLIGSAMTIICYDLTMNCRPFMVVENVIIANKYRNNGYGTVLFNKIENIAKKYECYYIVLISSKKRNKFHGFYKKLGFNSKDNLAFKKYIKKY